MKKYLLLLIVLPFFIGSCNVTKTTVDYDPQVDFTQYKTYSFSSLE